MKYTGLTGSQTDTSINRSEYLKNLRFCRDILIRVDTSERHENWFSLKPLGGSNAEYGYYRTEPT